MIYISFTNWKKKYAAEKLKLDKALSQKDLYEKMYTRLLGEHAVLKKSTPTRGKDGKFKKRDK